jgi:hypothetical protein
MRRGLTSILLLALVAVLVPGTAQSDRSGQLDVIELFTSQACSACPPADELLGQLSGRDDLLALSYSVDYWNYLDWKDTLAEPAFSARQRAYAKTRGDRKVYTPQAVVNGLVQVVGSNAHALHEALAASSGNTPPIGLSVTASGESSLTITAGSAPSGSTAGAATLWLVVYLDSQTVRIKAGENEGRTITYHNVVRSLEPVAQWRGEAVSVTVDMPEHEDGQRCAVLLQEGTPKSPGRILSAARL